MLGMCVYMFEREREGKREMERHEKREGKRGRGESWRSKFASPKGHVVTAFSKKGRWAGCV